MDHFFQIGGRDRSIGLGPAEDEMLEGYSTLSHLAALTRTPRLGTLVTGVVYRHPGVLIKTVTTLDVLSGGRAYLGIGAAWNEREAKGLGIPFPPLRERFERLEETLQIAKHLWSGNPAPFEGRHYHLAEPISSPQPLTRPHPPILIGGSGEKKTLRLVAQYGDACNLFSGRGAAAIQAKLDVLKRHCEDVGRDYATIEKTTLGTVQLAADHMSSGEIVDQCPRARLSRHPARHFQHAECPRDQPHSELWARDHPGRGRVLEHEQGWPPSPGMVEAHQCERVGGNHDSGNSPSIRNRPVWSNPCG